MWRIISQHTVEEEASANYMPQIIDLSTFSILGLWQATVAYYASLNQQHLPPHGGDRDNESNKPFNSSSLFLVFVVQKCIRDVAIGLTSKLCLFVKEFVIFFLHNCWCTYFRYDAYYAWT